MKIDKVSATILAHVGATTKINLRRFLRPAINYLFMSYK